MTYTEAVGFIHSIARFGTKPGLSRIQALLERMGNPQNKLRFIHVAGTNGKGSTSAMLSQILKQAGYKTGLYISPFVLDFCERIQVNNDMVSHEELAQSTELVKSHWDELAALGDTPSEFEVITAVAMDYFARMGCEVVVLETGLGGRLDATNVITTPICSVITSIDFDHTEILGDTIEAITAEKCGIIKENGVTVSYLQPHKVSAEVISKTCAEKSNKLFVAKEAEIISMDINGSEIVYDGLKLHVPLCGEYQVQNAATVVEAARAAKLGGFEISDDNIIQGIAATKFPCRFEVLSELPLVIVDGAHNLSGGRALASALKLLNGRKIHAVAAFMSDKDADGILKEVLPHCFSLTVHTLPQNPRSMPVTDIYKVATKYCENVYIAGTLDSTVIEPLTHHKDDDVILYFGSLYFASEVRPAVIRLIEKFN